MNDDQVLEYLRGRGRGEPPLDLNASVMDAIADAPQRRSSWFAPFIPAAAAVGAAAAVTVLALLVSLGPNMGPPPGPSVSVSESAAPTDDPSASPSPTPTPTTETTPSTHDTDLLEAEWPRPALVYVAREGLPFSVLDSAEADALFADADTCTNTEGGYTVDFPESWYTNTEIGDVPACSWFSPVFYEATEGGPVPEEIAIAISVNEGAIGFIWVDLYSEEVMLDGFGARRYETGMTKDVETPTDQFQYSYLAYLDEDSEGRKLWAFTGTEYGGDYELNQAVFDRIMASLEFTN